MAEICFWYDRSWERLVIRHCPTGEMRVIHKLQPMIRFLSAYGIRELEEAVAPCHGDDRLHLFKRMQVHQLKR
jgi:hypothetical protein